MLTLWGIALSLQEDDLGMIAAQQFYIDHGSSPTLEKLQSVLPRYIPDFALNRQHSMNFWKSTIMRKFKTQYFTNDKIRAQKVKEDIVSYAKHKWPLLFSRFNEAHKIAGPSLPKNDVIIAVNWTGVYVVDDQEQVLLELSFSEITAVSSSRSVQMKLIDAYAWAHLVNFLSSAGYIYQVTIISVGWGVNWYPVVRDNNPLGTK